MINKSKLILLCCAMILLNTIPLQARMVTQLTPTLTITEEYTNNYYKADINQKEQFITTCKLGFSLGLLEKKYELYLNYNPLYKDYDTLDDNDGFDHIFSLDGNFLPTKHSSISYGLHHEITEVDREGESRNSNAFVNGSFNLSKNTILSLSQNYSNSYDQQVTTGTWNESDTNRSSAGISHQFGKKDSIAVNYDYSFTEYNDPNSDDYTSNRPSAFLSFWFTPLYGFDSNFSYETIEYDLSNTNTDTISGDIRLLKKMTKHLDIYIKYKQTNSDQDTDVHDTYYPSIGFDWKPTKDSGISLGGGILFQDYENRTEYESEKLFCEFDMYKNFDFNKRGSVSITGSSGYSEIDDSAASLGFNIYYQAGLNFTYKLTKRLTTDISTSYKINEFDGETTDRTDNTLNLKAGLNWAPLKWLKFNLAYDYNDFDTDSTIRKDYRENKGTISVSFIPSTPVRLNPTPSRKSLEEKVYTY